MAIRVLCEVMDEVPIRSFAKEQDILDMRITSGTCISRMNNCDCDQANSLRDASVSSSADTICKAAHSCADRVAFESFASLIDNGRWKRPASNSIALGE
jgi:hypothetical protein